MCQMADLVTCETSDLAKTWEIPQKSPSLPDRNPWGKLGVTVQIQIGCHFWTPDLGSNIFLRRPI